MLIENFIFIQTSAMTDYQLTMNSNSSMTEASRLTVGRLSKEALELSVKTEFI